MISMMEGNLVTLLLITVILWVVVSIIKNITDILILYSDGMKPPITHVTRWQDPPSTSENMPEPNKQSDPKKYSDVDIWEGLMVGKDDTCEVIQTLPGERGK